MANFEAFRQIISSSINFLFLKSYFFISLKRIGLLKKANVLFRGTDGFVYKPKVEKSDTLFIFNRDLCRSLPLEYHSEMTDSNGIPGYR